MNRNNNKSKNTNQNIKQLRQEVNSLRRRLTNNAPVSISSKSGSQGKDYYHTKGMERISDVSAVNSDYAVTGVFLNAANPSLFPWLSGIAKKYDLYRFKKLIFRYKPSLPTSEAGNVYLGIDYNTLDPAPPTSTDFCQLSHWNTNVVWKPQSLQAKVPSTDWFYTRSGNVPNADYKTYDIGKFFVAVENISYLNTVGYLEVDYEVEFARRQPDYVSTQPPVGDLLHTVARYKLASVAKDAKPELDGTFIYDNSQGDSTLGTTDLTVDKPGVYKITFNNQYSNPLHLVLDSTNVGLCASNSEVTVVARFVNTFTISASNDHTNSSTLTPTMYSYLIIEQIA